MEVGKLKVQRRDSIGKGIARKLRANGHIPGVCYGTMLENPIPIAIETNALKGSLDPDKLNNTVINVTIEGEGQPTQDVVVMVKDYQLHKIRHELLHVDLLAIDTEKEIEVEVPIEITGKAKGLVLGGLLHTVLYSIDIRCKPMDIPGKASVDVTELDIGDVLHVSDLELPEEVNVITPEYLAIVTCNAPEAEEEETTDEAAEGEEGEKGP